MLKGKGAVKSYIQKGRIWLKLSGMLRIEREGLRRDWWGSRLKKGNSHFWGLRGRRHLEDHSTSLLRAAWTVEVARSTFGEESKIARSSA